MKAIAGSRFGVFSSRRPPGNPLKFQERLKKYHGGHYYGKARNITRRLTAAYDKALDQYDLLHMPTMPMKATPLPKPNVGREEYFQRALEMIGNTCPFDITHHPAMTVPCGLSGGLPIGMMLIGKHSDEATIYRAAYAFEQAENPACQNEVRHLPSTI